MARRKKVKPTEVEFGIGQAAWFFDRNTQWLRGVERDGILVTQEGEPIVPTRKESNKLGGGDRRYTVEDVREIGHSLRRAEMLTDSQLRSVLKRVDAFSKPLGRE